MLNQQGKPKRILVVDDEPTLVFFLKQGLQESQFPCNVDVAASGEEALTKLTYNRYDLLITDLKMPGISGFTLIEVARSLYQDIRVILMTAFGSREVQDEAKQLEVEGYLTKPFPTAQLRDLVNNILAVKDKNSQTLVAEQELLLFPGEQRSQEGQS